MSRTITEFQARVFEYAKSRLGTWFTIQELSTDANIPAGSAKGQADRFQERGLFELLKISPAQVYRMTEESVAKDPGLVHRIEQAIPIFAQRRQGWLEREAARLGSAVDAQHSKSRGPATATAPRQAQQSRTAMSVGSVASKNAVVAEKPRRPSTRPGRPKKADQLIELLQRPGGASIDELVAHFGTQPHSIRALISVTMRGRGLKAQCENGRYQLT